MKNTPTGHRKGIPTDSLVSPKPSFSNYDPEEKRVWKNKAPPKSLASVSIPIEDLRVLFQFGTICAAGYNNRKNYCKETSDVLGARNYEYKANLAFDLLKRVRESISKQGYDLDTRT